jgi:aspartate aminotransferase
MKLSYLSESLVAPEILKISGEVKKRIGQGETIDNFTVGDFDPALFPIPEELEREIIQAYRRHFTNYPAAEGNLDLREAVQQFIWDQQGLQYATDEILIAAGGRPLIYALFRAICDEGDKVVYTVPSWNNNHYTHFVGGEHVIMETKAENKFMPTAEELRPYLKGATLLALCSPQNPTGTTFSKDALKAICTLVVEENSRRAPAAKKLYVLFDQMYGLLTYGDCRHYDPVTVMPQMRSYTVFVDAVSKSFAATGVRVGWSMGPVEVLAKMKAILSHVGAWAPMAEQKAVAVYLSQKEPVQHFLTYFRKELQSRLELIYEGIRSLYQEGYPVEAIAPEAAIYLTIKIDLTGKKGRGGVFLSDQAAVTTYLLTEAKLALIPFSAFGASSTSAWYRLSVGTCKKEAIERLLQNLRQALEPFLNTLTAPQQGQTESYKR